MTVQFYSMKRVLFIALLMVFMVSGCTSPSPKFFGAPRTDLTVENSRFRVFHYPGSPEVEVHRLSFEARPGWSATQAKAARAIEIVTGCQLRDGSLAGDPAIITAEVDCYLAASGGQAMMSSSGHRTF